MSSIESFSEYSEEEGLIQVPDKGRPYLEIEQLNGSEIDRTGADDVFEDRNSEINEVYSEGVGTFVGVNALIGRVFMVPFNLIDPNPNQPRTRFEPIALDELGNSIQTTGQIDAISVATYTNEYGEIRFALVDGERRWQALVNIRASHAAVIVKWIPDNRTLYNQSVISNLHREGHTDMEYARIFEKNRLEAVGQGITTFTGQIDYVHQKTGKGLSFIKRHLELINLDNGIQELVHQGYIKMSQAFLVREVSQTTGVSETDLAFKVLGITNIDEAEQLSKTNSWGRLSKSNLQEAALMISRGQKVQIDPHRVNIRKRAANVLGSIGDLTRHAGRLLSDTETNPATTQDILKNLHGTPVAKLRENIKQAIALLLQLDEVASEVEGTIMQLPEIPGRPLMSGWVEENKDKLLVVRGEHKTRDMASKERQLMIMRELAKAGDARTEMPVAFELANILNELHGFETPLTPTAVSNALQHMGRQAALIGMVLDLGERHLRDPKGDFNVKQAYRLAWPEQLEQMAADKAQNEEYFLAKLTAEAESSGQNPVIIHSPESHDQMTFSQGVKAVIIERLAKEALSQMGLKRTKNNMRLMTFLLESSNGESKGMSDLYLALGAESPAQKSKVSTGLTVPLRKFAEIGLIELNAGTKGKARTFSLIEGGLPVIEPEKIEEVLSEIAKTLEKEHESPFTAERILAFCEGLEGASLNGMISKRVETVLTVVSPTTPIPVLDAVNASTIDAPEPAVVISENKGLWSEEEGLDLVTGDSSSHKLHRWGGGFYRMQTGVARRRSDLAFLENCPVKFFNDGGRKPDDYQITPKRGRDKRPDAHKAYDQGLNAAFGTTSRKLRPSDLLIAYASPDGSINYVVLSDVQTGDFDTWDDYTDPSPTPNPISEPVPEPVIEAEPEPPLDIALWEEQLSIFNLNLPHRVLDRPGPYRHLVGKELKILAADDPRIGKFIKGAVRVEVDGKLVIIEDAEDYLTAKKPKTKPKPVTPKPKKAPKKAAARKPVPQRRERKSQKEKSHLIFDTGAFEEWCQGQRFIKWNSKSVLRQIIQSGGEGYSPLSNQRSIANILTEEIPGIIKVGRDYKAKKSFSSKFLVDPNKKKSKEASDDEATYYIDESALTEKGDKDRYKELIEAPIVKMSSSDRRFNVLAETYKLKDGEILVCYGYGYRKTAKITESYLTDKSPEKKKRKRGWV